MISKMQMCQSYDSHNLSYVVVPHLPLSLVGCGGSAKNKPVLNVHIWIICVSLEMNTSIGNNTCVRVFLSDFKSDTEL